MSESIINMKRSMLCAEPTEAMVGEELTLMGWCHKARDLGGLTFITLRDRSGEIQLVVTPESPADVIEKASRVRSEFVLACKGRVQKRSAPNPDMKTGQIEIAVDELRILSESQTPPFYIEEGVEVNDTLRLKHRYLDLRRPDMQRNMILRHRIAKCARDYFDEKGFVEIETPMLGKSTPEGARDYLVPSRIKQGSFFALPQSPQLYKQLLMLAGYDRYIQVVKCFRDEDLRADRQPEFTQIDLEMSFVDMDDVIEVTEGFLLRLFQDVMDIRLETPFLRLSYQEAMDRFGSDKPDIRFGLELSDIAGWAKDVDFVPFNNTLSSGGSIRAICVPGGAAFSRRELDALTEVAKTYRAGGLAWLVPSDTPRGSFLKFVDENQIKSIAQIMGATSEDAILIVSGDASVVYDALGAVRCAVAQKLDMIPQNTYAPVWVTDFPLFEYDEEELRYVAKHHPFTRPHSDDMHLLESAPEKVRSNAYDIVLNGMELGGGSIRIHEADLQKKMFELLGFTSEQAMEQFGFLLQAFQYGVPPHGGLAFGLDRIAMILAGTKSIRDVIAFPKVQNSSDLMTQAPAPVADAQLEDLGIRTVETMKENANGPE